MHVTDRMPHRRPRTTAWVAAASLLLMSAAAGCSATGSEEIAPSGTHRPSASAGAAPDGPGTKGTVVLVTHSSFPDELVKDAQAATGYEVQVVKNGDAGELTNKLLLTKDAPLGDAAFGVDNTFASRPLEEGVFASPAGGIPLPKGAEAHALDGDKGHTLTPIDFGDVCVNVDDAWFAAKHLAKPETFEDLTKPAYKNLFVVPGATTSSPGLAFLLATVAKDGDGWKDYWKRLMANGTKVVAGWEDAYNVDFSGGTGEGDRPIVVSYSSSPPFTVPKGKTEPTTSALLRTCFRQVEYAGVLAGAKNPEGARAVIAYLLSPTVQAKLPETMYMYPVDPAVKLPATWAKYAKTADEPWQVPAGEITSRRKQLLTDWAEIATP